MKSQRFPHRRAGGLLIGEPEVFYRMSWSSIQRRACGLLRFRHRKKNEVTTALRFLFSIEKYLQSHKKLFRKQFAKSQFPDFFSIEKNSPSHSSQIFFLYRKKICSDLRSPIFFSIEKYSQSHSSLLFIPHRKQLAVTSDP